VKAAVKRESGQAKRGGAKSGSRIGRPMKDPSGKRDQVTVLLRADIKRALIKAAQEHGRTLSQEGEHWFERLLQYESVLGTPVGAVEQVLMRNGFHPLGISNPRTGKRGKAWAEPGLIEDSGFVPFDEGELEAMRAQQEGPVKKEPK
jgi:hypothetical protein